MIEREPPAETDQEIRRRHAANRVAWNEGAAAYTQELDDTIAHLKAGNSNLHPVERRNLGDLGQWCDTAIHLQCASGRDTLSLINEGVRVVVGVDISDAHIDNARRMTSELGWNATWFRCDVLDTPTELDETANLVYTGRGAITWLHDLEGWAAVVFRLLKPGGVFHIFDEHPVTWIVDERDGRLQYTEYDYFQYAERNKGWPETYIGNLGKPVADEATKHERVWPLSEIVQALIDAGLRIDLLAEHPDEYWDIFPNTATGGETAVADHVFD